VHDPESLNTFTSPDIGILKVGHDCFLEIFSQPFLSIPEYEPVTLSRLGTQRSIEFCYVIHRFAQCVTFSPYFIDAGQMG
jgi:hypothetical protein